MLAFNTMLTSSRAGRLLRVLKALADPTRLRLLQHLAAADLCVGELARRLSITSSAASQHLRILRDAGLVTPDKRGFWVHYQVNRTGIDAARKELSHWLEGLATARRSRCPRAARPARSPSRPAISATGGSTNGRIPKEV